MLLLVLRIWTRYTRIPRSIQFVRRNQNQASNQGWADYEARVSHSITDLVTDVGQLLSGRLCNKRTISAKWTQTSQCNCTFIATIVSVVVVIVTCCVEISTPYDEPSAPPAAALPAQNGRSLADWDYLYPYPALPVSPRCLLPPEPARGIDLQATSDRYRSKHGS